MHTPAACTCYAEVPIRHPDNRIVALSPDRPQELHRPTAPAAVRPRHLTRSVLSRRLPGRPPGAGIRIPASHAEMSTSSGLISMHALEYSLMISRPSDDHVQPSAGRPGTSIGGRWPSWPSACRGSGHRWTRRLACRSHSPRRSRGLARRGAGMGAARPTLRGRCGPAGIAPRRRAAQAGEDLHRPGRLGRGPDHRAEDAPAGHPVDPGRAADRDAGPSAGPDPA